jgi:zeaxanthin glucosyltransferase
MYHQLDKEGGGYVLPGSSGSFKNAGVEALLVDQVSSEGAIVAEFLDIPFVTVCSAVVLESRIQCSSLFHPLGL